MAEWLAHISEDRARKQTVAAHLEGTAELARQFAEAFHAGGWGAFCGMAHDIGKFTAGFQKRLLENGCRVDHATAGAILANRLGIPAAAFCIAGHHGGLPDGGYSTDVNEETTLRARLKKEQLLEACAPYEEQITLTPPPPPALKLLEQRGYSLSFFIRMLYSCLVDADYLDTERFMSGGCVERGEGESISALCEKLQDRLSGWLQNREADTLNGRRSGILRACLSMAEEPQGLYSLTVPTGGGKTLASLAFALRHAQKYGLERVIYVIPYTSIIEQNAQVFRDYLGDANILEHHASFDFDADEQADGAHHLAAENWDAPVIVTTNVQFFESLYAAKPGRCRKLHHISRSVLIFDEAQMLPVAHIKPCVRAIGELCANYGCTAVLCTATQPSLGPYFPDGMTAREICPGTKELFQTFRRTTLRDLGCLSDEALAAMLKEQPQALCIVNTRKQAQRLYHLLSPEGSYHLSTLLYPEHRKKLLAEIRARLDAGLPCRVVSTSLIEAGVDVDFPAVYRAECGLDSLLQAAGRCNRNGKRAAAESIVFQFSPEAAYTAHLPDTQRRTAAALRSIAPYFDDLTAPEAITAYFTELYGLQGDGLDKHRIVEQLEKGLHNYTFPFRSLAKEFHLIDDSTRAVLIPGEDRAKEIAETLKRGERSRGLLRTAGRYSVNIYQPHFESLLRIGALEQLEDDLCILRDLELYDGHIGLVLEVEGGKGIFT